MDIAVFLKVDVVRVQGCDEDEDCPEGKFCIYVNHMCQC